MGEREDYRNAFQGTLDPEFKALVARLESLESEHLEFAPADKTNYEPAVSAKSRIFARFFHAEEVSLQRSSPTVSDVLRHERLLATMAANHAETMEMLWMNQRLTRLESERKAEPPQA